MIVIADTTALNYLVLIDQAELLPKLFGSVLIPPAVRAELGHPSALAPVRQWISRPPTWLQVQPLVTPPDKSLEYLDSGEREAIALAEQIRADLLLLDETEARREAARRGLQFIGTLGVLREAARRDLVELPAVLAALKATSFYVDPTIIQHLLEEDVTRKKEKG